MILVLDNRDSFTFNLVQALLGLGARVEVRRTRGMGTADVANLAPDGIVIGPGPGAPAGAGCSVDVIRRLGSRVPMLGVCLGHQAIAAAFGGRVGPARNLVHGRAVEVDHDGGGVLAGLRSPLRCARYNSLTVLEAELPACLTVSARSTDGDLMGLRHRTWPLEGVQFHPESILSEEGDRLFANFLRRCASATGRAAPLPAD